MRVLPFLLLLFSATASFAVMVPPADRSLEQQIEFIDQEIILLRAELAQSSGDLAGLKRYLQQLRSMNVDRVFQARVELLERFLSSAKIEAQNRTESAFTQPLNGDQVVILLPLSGDYEVAGQAILEGIKQAWPFSRPFVAIDSALYHSMNELFELVKLYEPDFIIGPLNKQNIIAWQNLETQIPTLYLNYPNYYFEYERAVAPNKTLALRQLKSFIEATALEHIAVLHSDHKTAQTLQTQFKQAWLKQSPARGYSAYAVEGNIHQSMQRALNVRRSVARKNWVEKSIQHELEFEPRARQDLDAVVFFTSVDEAIQVKPILDFYHLNATYSLWFPSVYPSAAKLQSKQHNWQQTYAFIPPYLMQEPEKSVDIIDSNPESGLFYALGELVAEIVKNPRLNLPEQHLADSSLGELITDESGSLIILPDVFWLDEKSIQPVNEYRYQFE